MSQLRGRFARSKARQGDSLRHQIPAPFPHSSPPPPLHRIYIDRCIIWSGLFWPSVTWNLRKAQRWSLEQKRFEVRSLSPALRNLWLSIVLFIYLFIIFQWNMLCISCTTLYLRVDVTDLHCSRRFPGTFWHFRKTPLRMWCSHTFGLQGEKEEVVLSISGCKALILYIDRSSNTRRNWKRLSVRAVTSVQACSWRIYESLIK